MSDKREDGLEEAARWHDAQAALYDREAHERIAPDGCPPMRDSAWAKSDAADHRKYAAGIRSMIAQ